MERNQRRLQELGALIRQARQERGLTVSELGRLVYGESGKSSVSRVENGEIGIAPDVGIRYLKHLQLSGGDKRRFLELTGLRALAQALQREDLLPGSGDIATTGQDILDYLADSERDRRELYVPARYLTSSQLLLIAAFRLEEEEGDWQQAQECYRRVVELAPVGPEQAIARIGYAHQFINTGALLSAEKEFLQILTDYEGLVDPSILADARLRLGWVYHVSGRHDLAEEHLQRALRIARQFASWGLEAQASHFVGRNLYEIALKEDSAELMQSALMYFYRAGEARNRLHGKSENPFDLRWMARCFEYLGREREMRDCRQEALWMWKPNKPPYRTAYVQMDSAQTDLHAGRYREAMEKLYESAVLFADARCVDSLAECLVVLAKVCLEQGRRDSSLFILDLCLSAVCLHPYPSSPLVRQALQILRTLSDTNPDLVKRRLEQIQYEPVFSVRTVRELIPEFIEDLADPRAGYQIIVAALKEDKPPEW